MAMENPATRSTYTPASRAIQLQPPSRHLVEAFQREQAGVPGTPEEERPRFNPLNTARPRSSVLLNMNDAIAMHLLVETAIADSNEYELLSYEEVDDLKKEHVLLVNRIDASRRKLVLESKVRDAATSLSRLYSPKSKVKQRRSLMGSDINGGNGSPITDVMRQANDELVASNRKCEELAMEIWKLEVRAGEIQRRLLQHTAGVLGMTHHDNRQSAISMSGSTIGSPKGHGYTLSNGKISSAFRDVVSDEFDERSFYKTVDNLDDIQGSFVTTNRYYGGLGVHNTRGISTDNAAMPTSPRHGKRSSSSASLASPDGLALAFTERRILELNTSVRDFLVRIGAQIPTSPSQPRSVPIPTVGVNGQRQSSGGAPVLGGSPVFVVQEQLSLLEQGIKQIQKAVVDVSTATNGPAAEVQRKLERTETILGSLWEVLLVGEEELGHKKKARQRRRDRREERAEMGDDEDDMGDEDSDGEDDQYEETDDEDEPVPTNTDEDDVEFTISTFSGKVHNLYERATRLHAERTSLRKHLAEQRTTNFQQIRLLKEEHDAQMAKLEKSVSIARNELSLASEEQTNLIREKEDELRTSKEEFSMVMQQLDNTRRELQLKDNQQGSMDNEQVQKLKAQYDELLKDLKTQLEEANHRVLEAEERAEDVMRDADDRIEEHESKMTNLETDFREISAKHTTASNTLRERDEMVAMLQGVVDELEAKAQTSSTSQDSHEQTMAELNELRDRLLEHEEIKTRLREHEVTVKSLQGNEQSHQAVTERLKTQLNSAEKELEATRSRDTEFIGRETELRGTLNEKSALITSMEDELRSLEGEVARLSTEVAILQAEIDETHGTSKQQLEAVRRQAAAALQAEAGRPQAAMDPEILMELEDLSKKNQELLSEIKTMKDENSAGSATTTAREQALHEHCEELQKELNEMLYDFETLTKTSIEFEGERGKLESDIDTLREKIETLESSLADEKVRWLGTGGSGGNPARSPGIAGPGPGPGLMPVTPGSSMGFGPNGENTSTSVLKTEFKKMMRDMRAEQTKTLRGEQELRRKLEGELRQLKKDHQQLQKQQFIGT